MKINIAGEQLLLTVPYTDQDHTRETEQNVNMLYRTWQKRFPEKSEMELLAMVAYQYASYYDSLKRSYMAAGEKTEAIEEMLDRLLNNDVKA